MQYRIGPNRVGPFGLLQPLADGVKFIFKEELRPTAAEHAAVRAAPVARRAAFMAFAPVPFGAPARSSAGSTSRAAAVADLDVGILFIFALASMGVYGMVLAGWASNSKYSLMGGLRARRR